MTDLALNLIVKAQDQSQSVLGKLGKALENIKYGLLNIDTPGTIAADNFKAAGKDMQGAMLGVAGALAIAGAGAAIWLGDKSVHAAADFQQALLKTQALAGLTSQQTRQLGDQMLALAPQVGQSPKQLADSLYFLASAGVPAKNMMDVMRLSAEAAATGNFDAKLSADALTSAVNASGVGYQHAGDVMDELTATVTSGKMEWKDFATVVGKLASSMAQNNIKTQEGYSALAVFTNSGVSARQAATYLNNAFIQLEMKTDSIAKNAKKLHIAFDETKFKSMDLRQQIEYLNQISGGHNDVLLKLMNNNSTAAKTVEFLRDHYTQWSQTMEQVSKAMQHGKTTQDAFAITQQGFNQKLKDAQAAWDAMLVKIGQQLLPVLTQLMDKVTPMIVQFGDWIVKSGTIQQGMGVVTTVIGDAATAIGGFVGWLQKGGPWVDLFKTALAGVASYLIAKKAIDFGQSLFDMGVKAKNAAVNFGNLLLKIKDDAFSLFAKQTAPDIKQGLDDVQTSADNVDASVQNITTDTQVAQDEIDTATATMQADLDGVQSSADTTSAQLPDIGTNAEAAAAQVQDAAAKMEGDLQGVQTAAQNAGTAVSSVGTDAETASSEVTTASGQMESNLNTVGTDASTAAASAESIGTDTQIAAKDVEAAAPGAEGAFAGIGSSAMSALGPAMMLATVAQQIESGLGLKNSPFQLPGITPNGTQQAGQNVVGITTGPLGGVVNWLAGLFGGHAAGGSNLPGGWSVVGEQGPELLYNPQGSTILPAGATRSVLAGSGGGGHTFNINVNGGMGSPDEIASAIRYQLAELMRSYANLPNITSGGRL